MNRGFLSLALAVLALIFVSVVILSNHTLPSALNARSVENIPSSQLLVWTMIDQNVANYFASQTDPNCNLSSTPSIPDFSILDDAISCNVTTPTSLPVSGVAFEVEYDCTSLTRAY